MPSGVDDSNDSDIDISTGQTTHDYNLTSGEHNRSVDAGFFIPVKVGDRVWIDRDYNGTQDIRRTPIYLV